MENYKILFVDDDSQILSIVDQYLQRCGYDITTVSSGLQAIDVVGQNHYSIVFTDMIMPEISGMELLKRVKQISPATEVIIVSGYGTIESAIAAMKSGCYDFLQKPINFDRLKILIDRIFEKQKLKEENQRIRNHLKERYKYDGLVGTSPKMQAIYEVIDKISASSPTVLIKGESGTGKGLTANIIHNNSNRKSGPFVTVNCGAIAESLLERELFGHVKGAFTGASKDAEGLFKAADGGTIFLDEIAEVSPNVQVSLLHVLQEKKIRPVGDTREIRVDVRVIAATNKNLDEAIRSKTFREDLFYRLNVIPLTMPPLREISEDIPLLVNHFINRYNPLANTSPTVTAEAMGKLMGFHWPGNVRQLENVVQRAFALGVTESIGIADLPGEIRQQHAVPTSKEAVFNLKKLEMNAIRRALKETSGNKAEAARLLGVNTTTVYRKMAKYGIADS